MIELKDHLIYFMDKLEYPDEAKNFFNKLHLFFEKEEDYNSRLIGVIADFNNNPSDNNKENILEKLGILAQDIGISPYSIYLIFFMYCSKRLLDRYKEENISIEIYWNTMLELKCKLVTTYDIYGVWGSFVGDWFFWFFNLKRFGIGRLQYERISFPYNCYRKGKYLIKKGDTVYNTHIPSSGPLKREEVIESFKRAFRFYKHELKNIPMVIVCDTWLIYPDNKKFFPNDSNIIHFMELFDIIDVKHDRIPLPSRRVFGKDYKKPFEQLPQNTSLQKAFVNWFSAGNTTGEAYGVIIFDGENIL